MQILASCYSCGKKSLHKVDRSVIAAELATPVPLLKDVDYGAKYFFVCNCGFKYNVLFYKESYKKVGIEWITYGVSNASLCNQNNLHLAIDETTKWIKTHLNLEQLSP